MKIWGVVYWHVKPAHIMTSHVTAYLCATPFTENSLTRLYAVECLVCIARTWPLLSTGTDNK